MRKSILFTVIVFGLARDGFAMDCSSNEPSLKSSFPAQNACVTEYDALPEDPVNGSTTNKNRSFSADLIKTCEMALNRKLDTAAFSPEELVMIYAYTRDLYRVINPQLRNKTPDASLSCLLDSLDSALTRFPVFSGWVVRGTYLPAEIQKDYFVGSVVQDLAFLSTSVDEGTKTNYTETNPYTLHIYSHTGRDIETISRFPLEREILFSRETKFKVLRRIETGSRSAEITLEEIP